jgi:hypothetical protein
MIAEEFALVCCFPSMQELVCCSLFSDDTDLETRSESVPRASANDVWSIEAVHLF